MKSRFIPLFFVSAITYAEPMSKFPSLSMSVQIHEATIVFGAPIATPAIIGAAYSADEVLERTKTLPNGKHETHSGAIGHFFRDSLGRTRAEQVWKGAPVWTTEIFDPVAGFAYILDEQKKIAHRMTLQPAPRQSLATRTSAGLQQTTTENLGMRTIEGIDAQGTRTITTVPTGSGNPKTLTVETWDSHELEVTVLTTSSNGYTDRLTHVSRAEPDPK